MRARQGPNPNSGSLRVRWSPADFPLRGPAEAVLRECVRELGLAGVVHDLSVSVDLRNRDDHAYIEWNTHDHRAARLWFALGNFVTSQRRRTWSRTWSRRPGAPPLEPRHFSARSFAEGCLHELCHLKDDHESGVDLSGHPERDREALNELWNVWIDGRLNRRGFPAISRAERRRVFERTLGRAPRYGAVGERIFRALWRADHLGPRELRAYLNELQGPSTRPGATGTRVMARSATRARSTTPTVRRRR
ncbi:MAG TPA: hypothetical protein VFV24_03335 [Candidatus Eisenbacteria bacterium]|nr:hypothetical protein [Candidatus Eisenbacteria bacterium]